MALARVPSLVALSVRLHHVDWQRPCDMPQFGVRVQPAGEAQPGNAACSLTMKFPSPRSDGAKSYLRP